MLALVPLPGGYRVGVDIEGTFTDIVLERDDVQMHTTKVLTTPSCPGGRSF